MQSGILNSPGSYQSVIGTDFLDPIYSQAQFGPFGGGPARTYCTTNSFGLGDAVALDPILSATQLGLRVNCQVQYNATTWSNLQTHLQIDEVCAPLKSSGAAGKNAPRLTLKQKAEMLQKVMKRLKRKPSR